VTAPEALAFDMYGTLVDPIEISDRLAEYLPENALRVAEIWRQTQLELSWRVTLMERYESFEALTRKALDHALAAVGRTLDVEQKEALMARYGQLERFPDVMPGLKRLRQAGHAMVVFSNGNPSMLAATMSSAELDSYFDDVISVEEVGRYKPAPAAYLHVASRLGRPIEDVRLVSSNPFDDIGAEAAGMKAAWVNRSGGLFDPLGPPPEIVVETLTELADALAAR